MKYIKKEQIDAIIAEFYKLNAPVQNFEALRKMLMELPEVTEKKNDKEK
jgi:hypothetical protein